MSHTPLPWSVYLTHEKKFVVVREEDGDRATCVAEVAMIGPDDAEFIVKAVNNYDALLSALKVAREHVVSIAEHNERVNGGKRSEMDRADLEIIDAAIAAAEPKGE